MFKSVDINLQPGPTLNFWRNLIRQIQTEIEHKRVTNDTIADMVKGDIVYMTTPGDRQAALAQADAAESSLWAAVMAEPVAAGERGIARCDGYALIHMQDDEGVIAGSEGAPIYLSATVAGRGSMTTPVAGFRTIVAMLADASQYSAENPFVWGILGHCCAPDEIFE